MSLLSLKPHLGLRSGNRSNPRRLSNDSLSSVSSANEDVESENEQTQSKDDQKKSEGHKKEEKIDNEKGGEIDRSGAAATNGTAEPNGEDNTGKTVGEVKGRTRGVRAKTTWHQKAPNSFFTWIMHHDLGPEEIYFTLPERHVGRMPVHPIWRENVFILQHALRPILAQALCYWAFPDLKWNSWAALVFYSLSLINFAIQHLRRLNRYQGIYGVFDVENRGRDMVSDKQIPKVAMALTMYIAIRGLGMFLLRWDKNEFPHMAWWWPIKSILWMISLDYFFYSYHRASHQVDFLWFIHQRHHATRHPTPIMSLYADEWQELLEVILVPLFGTLCLEALHIPLSFHELYVSVCYLLYVESAGHSGVRAVWGHPLSYYPLRLFGMELVIEDHDLHHRDGKAGHNFGKSTRVWDKLFGTIENRREPQDYY